RPDGPLRQLAAAKVAARGRTGLLTAALRQEYLSAGDEISGGGEKRAANVAADQDSEGDDRQDEGRGGRQAGGGSHLRRSQCGGSRCSLALSDQVATHDG